MVVLFLFSGIQGVQAEGESGSVEVVGEWPRVGDSTGTLVWILIGVASGLTMSLLRLSWFVASRASKVSLSLAVKVVKLDMISSSERPHVTAWLLRALALAPGSRPIFSGSTRVDGGDTTCFSRPGVF